MVRKGFVLGVALVALLVLLWATGGVVAGPPRPEGEDEISAQGDVEASAAVTWGINYQGRLTDAAGNPVPDGNYTIHFRLYDVSSGGTPLSTDTDTVSVSNGLFNAHLEFDPGSYGGYFNGQALWLGIEVGTDGEMTPRQLIRPVPYALSLRPGAEIKGETDEPVIKGQNDGHGDGVHGIAGWYGTIGVYGESGFGIGVKGQGEIGVSGQGSVGPGVEGRGGPVGVSGYSANGVGVMGMSDNSHGVYGQSDSTSPGIAGVHGLGATSSGLSITQEAGVLGDAAGGFGVAGLSNSSYGGYFESKLYHGIYAKSGSAYYAAIRAVNTGSGDGAYGV